ncbi:MAG: NUDIX hydrolase [Nitriliruptorales bacterium]|nr:NUDIX hydrolase [Nitriliruptorales bacterium]
MAEVATPRDAATVIVMRDAADGLEVFMLRRHSRSGFAANMWVFPGGVVDPGDGSLPTRRWTGLNPARLAERFGVDEHAVLAFHVAAARETFEEAGLLLARHGNAEPPDLTDPALLRLRQHLADRTKTVNFAAWLEGQDLVLDLSGLTYYSHWVTPSVEPRRYDTRFFIARVPPGQVAGHDRLETTDQQWVAPRLALEAMERGEMQLIYPTIKTLAALAQFDTIDAAVQAANAQPTIRRIQPHAELDDQGRFVRILHPDDPEFPSHLYEDSA